MEVKHILTDLDKYMFSIKNIKDVLMLYEKDINHKNIRDVPLNKIKHSKKENNQNNNTIIFPHHEDKLFWCFFIILNGVDEYNYINKNSFQIEKTIKIKETEKMKKYLPQLKVNKIKYLDVENELVNENKISIIGLHALCLLNDISIIYLKDKTYFEINMNNTEVKYIIEKKSFDSFCLHVDVHKDQINNIKENYYKLESMQKPILSISSYKLDQLKDICTKLDISLINTDGKQKKKAKLYEDIVMKI